MNGHSLKDLGENRIISRFRALASGSLGSDVVVGPGDDTAVLSCCEEGQLLLLACDMMTEGVHFRLDWAAPRQIGWKAVTQNLSDIAAMGGTPQAVIASLAAPGRLSESIIMELAEGLVTAASRYGASLVGGDLVGSTGPIALDVSIIGRVERTRLLLRRGAAPGDAILITGSLGAAGAGLAALESGFTEASSSLLAEALKAQHEPIPRLAEAQSIAVIGLATAMMDISDGLAEDLPRLCQESGVGALLRAEAIPIAHSCSFVADRLNLNRLRLALYGGEDYELLFTCPPQAVSRLQAVVYEQTGTAITVIGEIVAEQGVVLLDAENNKQSLEKGFDHFAV